MSETDPGITAQNLRLDFGERLFFGGRRTMLDLAKVFENQVRRLMIEVSGNPVRKLLWAWELVGREGERDQLDPADPRIYALPQFAGAIDTIIAGANLVCDGYPFEVPSLLRRIYETALAALYYIDNPPAYQQMRRNQNPPKPQKVRNAFLARSRAFLAARPAGDPIDVKWFEQLYTKLSNQAHSGPGVRAVANFDSDRLRIGPVDPAVSPDAYRQAFEGLVFAAQFVGVIASMAFEGEFADLTAKGEIQPVPLGDLEVLVREAAARGLVAPPSGLK